jgi:hypothetical protein
MERQKHNVAGESGFHHFFGVVEDRKDPLKAGRLRVRIFGKHTEDVIKIPTEELTWAQVIGGLSDYPNETNGIADGQLVFGFYADGEEGQIPVILGTFKVDGFSVNDPEGKKMTGFQDMREKKEVKRFDKTDFANGINKGRCNEENVNEAKSVQFKQRKENKKKIKNKLFSWNETEDNHKGKYPWVKSRETETGHLIEYDDTPGEERIYIWHRFGSYIELLKDGTINIKSRKDHSKLVEENDYDLVLKDKNIHVGNNLNIYVAKDANISVGGNCKTEVSGNYDIKCGGNFNVKASQIHLN